MGPQMAKIAPIQHIDPVHPQPRHIQRAVAILERTGTDEARKLLDELAGGLPDARLTMEAEAAVARLKRQSK